MPHILTDAEAMNALKISTYEECPEFELLQSAVDDGLLTETKHDWSSDSPIDPTAKLAASILIVCLRDGTKFPDSYGYKVVQLDAKAKAMA